MSGWVPVGLAGDLDAGTSTGTRIDGREYVVWRDQVGRAHVWEDRCPHRGMRLSFGFVRGDQLACLYHGWQFDGEGQCRFIPAHPDIRVPKTIRTTRFACAERLGIIWTHDGSTDLEPPDDAATTQVRSVTIDAPSQNLRALFAPEAALPVWRCEVSNLPVLIGVQALSEQETALHLVIAGQRTPAEQKTVAAWATSLRLHLESAAR